MVRRASRTKRRKSNATPVIRRLILAAGTAVIAALAALQVPGCSVKAPAILTTQPSVATAPAPTPTSKTNFALCPQHFPSFVPALAWPGQQRALCFESFAVLHSGESKTPLYTVERLTRASVEAAKDIKRVDRFYPEARLPIADRAQLDDYKGSGYDKGHMAAAGDMPTEAAKAQSFSLANMVPQFPKLNQQAWNQIEGATRKYALRARGDVYVFTGPAFGEKRHTIGLGKVWVPSHTWKLVYAPADKRAWAYWMTNDGAKHNLTPISYADLVRYSGLRLLPDHAIRATLPEEPVKN